MIRCVVLNVLRLFFQMIADEIDAESVKPGEIFFALINKTVDKALGMILASIQARPA